MWRKGEKKWEVGGGTQPKRTVTRIASTVLLTRIKVLAEGIYSQNESNSTRLDCPDWVLYKLLTWAAPLTRLKDSSKCTVWLTVISDSKLQGERHDKGEIALFTASPLPKGARCFDYFIHWLHLCFKPGACQSGNHLFQGSFTQGSLKTNSKQLEVLLHKYNLLLSLWSTWRLVKCSCLLHQDKILKEFWLSR